MAYLLDTNVFIQAKQLYYAPDFCPAFWDWLVQQNKKPPQQNPWLSFGSGSRPRA